MASTLQNLFCAKVIKEFQQFKQSMLKKDPDTIFNSSYKIVCMKEINDKLLEFAEERGDRFLEKLLPVDNLIEEIYADWLKVDDRSNEELVDSIWNSLDRIYGRSSTSTSDYF